MRAVRTILQILTLFIGVGVLALLLVFPHFEGRNDNATFFQIYFNDPFLVYVYTASIAFFIAVYQVYASLQYVGCAASKSVGLAGRLKNLKHCALVLVGFLLGAEVYFFVVQRRLGEDIAGGVAIGLFLILCAVSIATVAGVFEKRFSIPE